MFSGTQCFSGKNKQELNEFLLRILTTKNNAWKYEKEVRILSRSEFINRGIGITGVYLGLRTPEVMIEVIRGLSKDRFPIHKTQISGSTNKVEVLTQNVLQIK